MQADKIPDEIMREAREIATAWCAYVLVDGASDAIARALMARDKRSAEIAREVEKQKEILMAAGKGEHGQPGYVRDDTWTGWIAQAYAARSIAAAILTYGGHDEQR